MELGLSIFPVALFLTFLFLLDSFKLVNSKILSTCILWGCASALLAYWTNTFMLRSANLNFEFLSRYIAPANEEIIKSLFLIFLIGKKRIGFMIDAAIYGFAIGAGFSLVENIFYLQNAPDSPLLVWIIRGFGTALMHGGCTSLLAIILIGGKSRERSNLINFGSAFAMAYCIHSAFNHFYIDPIVQTLGIIAIYPLAFLFIFRQNEKQLQNWLEIEFSSEIELLQMIGKGQFGTTRSGEYLASLKSRFSGETIFDMYCYIQTYLDLSIKAKRNLMLKENDFPPIIEPDMGAKLAELAELRKRIGKIGEITLSPLIRMNYRDLWKLNSLK